MSGLISRIFAAVLLVNVDAVTGNKSLNIENLCFIGSISGYDFFPIVPGNEIRRAN
jgi:hypothetical protein